ncbi:uncharacterized protein PHACADRAFT_248326 [Phanerochaete carnosa HHB-10118-sp]|uniref:Peptidase A1 domain-containing protein n=1 Tax=Phanerochaete carnosa (strain HHB-10118-sp) TaxID=650164 RepID=K5XEV9_PHACS|nr:uncharacterized protein PHACADRAFT_248326 [Phanerochaete carnosa HHB-10118-sp]EKM61622.1 hypothetical protein PHACADRAFT_248326 [Phanerochaete carnosa HHB-10118-sp]
MRVRRFLLASSLGLLGTAYATPMTVRSAPVTLPVAKRVNTTGTLNLVAHDRARVAGLRARSTGGALQSDSIVGSAPSTNQAVDYVASIEIGNPPTTYSLLVDTASSNTWVGAMQPYVQTATSVQTRDSVHVTIGADESMSGIEFNDQVSIGNGDGLVIIGQSIGAATDTTGFDDSDGILGLGPTSLTIGTLSPDTTQSVPTVVDSLFQQAVIQQDLVAISFEPTNSVGNANGELTFGGTDSSKFIGSIDFTPITTTSPSSNFWGINQQIRYGTNTNILSETAGIIDTGTTLMQIATDAFQRYQTATGAVLDDNTGLLSLTLDQFSSLQSLSYVIGGVTFEFTANAQIWPRALNDAIGGDDQHVFLVVSDIGSNSGSGLDFINGMTWIERFYVVLDTGNQRVGIANTPFTQAGTN